MPRNFTQAAMKVYNKFDVERPVRTEKHISMPACSEGQYEKLKQLTSNLSKMP